MSGRALFFRRLIHEWRYQFGVIRTVVDWTILLYLLIPALVLAPFLYRDMWEYIELYWSEKIPFGFMLFLLLLLSSSGNFRTFLMEADVLYLLQRRQLIHHLKIYSFLMSFFQIILGSALLFVIVLPILKLVYHQTTLEVLQLFLTIIAFRMISITFKKITPRQLFNWVVMPVIFIAGLVLLFKVDLMALGLGSAVCIVAVSIYHFTQMPKMSRWFFKEIEVEREESVKYIRLIFALSPDIEKVAKGTKKKPLLIYRKSGRIFSVRNKRNGLLELTIKGFLRNKADLKLFIQMTLLASSAIFILPLWLKWVVYLSFIIFMNIWLKSTFEKMLKSPFFAVVPFDKETGYAVWPRFKKYFYLPALIFTSVIVVLSTYLDVIVSVFFSK